VTSQDQERRREDLAATSESMHDEARQIEKIEAEKQKLDVGDPRLATLSRDAERLAGQVARKSRVERAISEGGATDGGEPEGPLE
jgi:hypothetical protein